MYTEEFENFWKKYPKKEKKFYTFQKFKKIKENEKKTLMEGLELYIIKWKKEKRNLEYIPLASTFINQRMYYDEIIYDDIEAKKIQNTQQIKKNEKIEKIQNEKIIEENEKIQKQIPKYISSRWRLKIKTEIIIGFPRVWESQKQSRFYYSARINYYLNQARLGNIIT